MTAALLSRGSGAATPLSPAAGAPAAQRPARTVRTVLGAGYRWFARLLMVLAVLAFAGLAVGPHIFGYRTMTMLTGSMAPMINPGDVTIATPLAVSDVEVGMVISYHIPIDDRHVVSHRVISVDHGPDGSVTVETQGDANNAPDPWKATLTGDTAYQVRAVIPHLGTVIEALRNPIVNRALVYGAPALLAGWLILAIWRPAKDDSPAEENEEQS